MGNSAPQNALDRFLVGLITFGMGGLLLAFGVFGLWFWTRGGSIDIGPNSPVPAVSLILTALIILILGSVAFRR